MKRFIRQLKKNWIRVWLFTILAVCSIFVVYAAYTEVSSVKRVISTTTSPGEPFSSNCMKKEISSHRLSHSEFYVSVCNYDQNFPDDYSSSEIKYIFEAELKIKTEDGYKTFSEIRNLVTSDIYDGYVSKAAKYWIYKSEDDSEGVLTEDRKTFTSENGYKVTFGTDGQSSTYETLATKRSSSDIYTVRIDPDDLNTDEASFFVFVKAIPKAGALTELSARLYANKSKEDKASWTGNIQESNCATVDYDFYNYVITGNGIGTLDILWNENEVKVNKFFLLENNVDESVSTISDSDEKYGEDYAGWKKITLSVDSTVKSRYELQLYKVHEDQFMMSPSSNIACGFTKETEG